jgi:hypothetical protein
MPAVIFGQGGESDKQGSLGPNALRRPIRNRSAMKSVPPRGSGWVRHATLSLPQRGYVWKAQGCRALAATLGTEQIGTSTATRLRLFRSDGRRRNRVAVEIIVLSNTQGSRSGNPGLSRRSPVGARERCVSDPPATARWCCSQWHSVRNRKQFHHKLRFVGLLPPSARPPYHPI